MNSKVKSKKHPATCLLEAVDCRKGLKQIKDNSVSLVLTDPPYFIDGMGEHWNPTQLKKRAQKAKVIGKLPVGMKYDKKQSQDLKKFLSPIAKEWFRVVRPGGFVLCFIQPRLSHSVALAMEEAGIDIKDLYVWQRPGQAKAFSQNHFVMKRKGLSLEQKKKLIHSMQGRKTPQLRPMAEMIIMGQIPREGTFVDNWIKWKTGLIDVSNPLIDADKFPGTIIKAHRSQKNYGHITAKPVDLLRHFIRIFCPEGKEHTILDCFAGSGSTGEAALLEGRSFIGFEVNRQYVKRAHQRLKSMASA